MTNATPRSSFVSFTKFLLNFCVLCLLYVSVSGQDFKTVHPGVEYVQIEKEISGLKVKINLLLLDLAKIRLDVLHANDKAIGLETTSSIAKRHAAVAAINGGFFRLDKSAFAGEASDFLVIDGELLSEGNRGRIGLQIINEKKKTLTVINHSSINAWLGSSDSKFMIQLSGVNRTMGAREIVLFNSSFGKTTLTSQRSVEIVLNDCKRGKGWWENMPHCRTVTILDDSANSSIPSGGYVISLSPEKFKDKDLLLNELKIFQAVNSKKKAIFIKLEDSLSKTFSYSTKIDTIAGVPQLIKNGKIDITWEQEKASKSFVETRHPRTAVAKMKDGKFLMMTVDGRQPGVSVGMNLNELAEYLLSIGAIDAMNLDGGGSTTMFLDGKVVNTPSDKEGERKVGDAILVTLRSSKNKKTR